MARMTKCGCEVAISLILSFLFLTAGASWFSKPPISEQVGMDRIKAISPNPPFMSITCVRAAATVRNILQKETLPCCDNEDHRVDNHFVLSGAIACRSGCALLPILLFASNAQPCRNWKC